MNIEQNNEPAVAAFCGKNSVQFSEYSNFIASIYWFIYQTENAIHHNHKYTSLLFALMEKNVYLSIHHVDWFHSVRVMRLFSHSQNVFYMLHLAHSIAKRFLNGRFINIHTSTAPLHPFTSKKANEEKRNAFEYLCSSSIGHLLLLFNAVALWFGLCTFDFVAFGAFAFDLTIFFPNFSLMKQQFSNFF